MQDERIERPWIIVGLPRTGTSLLSMLLGLDPVARPLLQWEAAHPIPPVDPGGGGGGSPDRPHGQGPRGLDEAQPATQGHAPLRGHPGRGVRRALHVRRAHPRTRDPGPRADVRALARDRPTWRPPTRSTGSPSRPCSRASRRSAGSSRPPTTCGTSTPCSPPTQTPGSSGPTGTPVPSSPRWPAWPTPANAS